MEGYEPSRTTEFEPVASASFAFVHTPESASWESDPQRIRRFKWRGCAGFPYPDAGRMVA